MTSATHPPGTSSNADGATLGLRTLGALAPEGFDLPYPKALALLGYLSIAGPQPRKRLAVLFWPRATDALNRLSVTLSRIRVAAPGAVCADRQRVWSDLETDAARVLRALEEGRREAAIASYPGAFLDGVYLPRISEELEEWIAVTRDDLAGRVQRALVRTATELAQARHYDLAMPTAERALEIGGSALLPPDDLGQLHTLLTACGSPLGSVLRQEAAGLGLALASSRTEARLRLEREAGAQAVPHNLRPRSTSFVGRDRERLELAQILALADRRLVTLVGPGGIGKTRLALQAAMDQVDSPRFRDGVYQIKLEEAASANELPPLIAGALGLALQPDREPLQVVLDALRDRRTLLVLDNLEHLPDAVPVVTQLLDGCPHLALVVTSRDRLQLEAEWLFPLHGLPVPTEDLGADGARASAALMLLEARAQRSNPAFHIGPAEVRHAAEICALTAGSPLAIELAAAHVAVMSLEEIAAAIRSDLDFLQATTRTAPDRHRSLRVVFENSWRLLHEDDRACLRRLAVFRGGFTRDAANAVADATLSVLTSLVVQALIARVHGDRYERHPLLHQYTWEKLRERPRELDRCQRRHAAWALGLATTARSELNTTKGARWLDVLDAEHANLRAALDWADERREADFLYRLVSALTDFWIRRGHHPEALHWYGRLSRHADAITDRRQLAHALRHHAFVNLLQGNTEAPAELLGRSLAILREQRDDVGVAQTLSHMGILAVYQNRYDVAATHYDEALRLASAAGSVEGVARLLNNLGDVARLRGDLPTARRHYASSLRLERDLGDQQMVANVLGSLALVALAEGAVPEARACLRESIGLVRDLGITFSLPTAFEQAAELANHLGHPFDAARLWGAGEALRTRIGAPHEPFERPRYDAAVVRARTVANAAAFEVAWVEGRHIAVPDAIALALGLT